MRKSVFGTYANSENQDQLLKPYSLSKDIIILYYIVKCPIILSANSNGPAQPVQMRRLIWALVVRICPEDDFSKDAAFCNNWASARQNL